MDSNVGTSTITLNITKNISIGCIIDKLITSNIIPI